jgi:aspartate/methionine/tyrosine aminotransferase
MGEEWIAVRISDVAQAVIPSRIRRIASLADAHPGTLRLFVGEDTRPTPAFIKEAAVRAIGENLTYYTPNAGYPAVRSAVADRVRSLHGAAVDPEREVILTCGGMNAIVLAYQATLGPGTSAVIITPSWPNLMESARATGAEVLECPLKLEGDRFELDWDLLERTIRADTRILALASPGNPTGWTASHADWARLAAVAARRGLWLLADGAYERIVSDGAAAPNLLSLPEARPRTIHVNTMSKAYRMTGWRLGYLIAPPDITERMTHLQEFVVSHAPGIVQEAARIALEQGEPSIAEDQARYTRHRELAWNRLRQLPGLHVPRPQGAFYLFPRVLGLNDTMSYCEHLVRSHRVGFAPGAAFGAGGEGHLRICFAVDEHVLNEALDRFASAWVRDRELLT